MEVRKVDNYLKALPRSEEQCYICYSLRDTPEETVQLTCGHDIGEACLKDWLQKNDLDDYGRCPWCSTPLFMYTFWRRLRDIALTQRFAERVCLGIYTCVVVILFWVEIYRYYHGIHDRSDRQYWAVVEVMVPALFCKFIFQTEDRRDIIAAFWFLVSLHRSRVLKR